MKATGIVRRIDDLDRVVVPKEIRRPLRIREGDLLLTTSSEKMSIHTKNARRMRGKRTRAFFSIKRIHRACLNCISI